MSCCHGCRTRFLGCHGKNEDGSWKCEDWGKEQEAKEADYQRRREQYITDCYFADFRKEKMKQEKAHKAHRGKG